MSKLKNNKIPLSKFHIQQAKASLEYPQTRYHAQKRR
jgi:hypothetical protein